MTIASMAASGSILFFCFVSCFGLVFTFSTFSISETSGKALVCALTMSRGQQQRGSVLNCSSFPDGIVIPTPAGEGDVSGLAAGDGFQCVVRPTARNVSVMGCFRFSGTGGNATYKRLYNDSVLDSLVAGNSHVCGLVRKRTANRLECWQWPEFRTGGNNQFASDTKSIAVGEGFVCGLSGNGSVSCFKSNNRVFGSVPVGVYRSISAGFRHACAIYSGNGSITCWGDTVGSSPTGQFTELALGENRSCGLRSNGTVTCWGESNFSLPIDLQRTQFLRIEAKRSVFCGIEVSNFSLFCWGNENFRPGVEVFKDVLPGNCTDSCTCSYPLIGSDRFCPGGGWICQDCSSGGVGTPPPLTFPPPEAATPPPLTFPPPEAARPTKPTPSSWMVASLVVGCFGTLCLVLVGCFFLYKHCKCRGSQVHDSGPIDDTLQITSQNPNQNRADSSADSSQGDTEEEVSRKLDKRLSKLASMGNRAHMEEFSLQALLRATENFSDDRKIGTGSFGSVYHGVLDDGREVAIKRAEMSTPSFYAADATRREENRDSAFVNELESLSRLNHKNLVRLFGYCEDQNELALVYEYMNNGTLHDHLHKLRSTNLMSWTTRLGVALDAARGVEYLHVQVSPPVIHRDIKSSNILLDSGWVAKVSDFGLSLMGPDDGDTHLSLNAAGTVGYIDPEYYRLQRLTTKSDVYSFGVVLLELLSGYRAIHKNEYGVPRNVVDFVVPYIVQDEIHRVLDPNVPPPTPFEIEAVAYVGYLAADCVTLEGRYRPSMGDVVSSLERALAACLAPPSFSRYSRSSSEMITTTPVSARARACRSTELTPAPARPSFLRWSSV